MWTVFLDIWTHKWLSHSTFHYHMIYGCPPMDTFCNYYFLKFFYFFGKKKSIKRSIKMTWKSIFLTAGSPYFELPSGGTRCLLRWMTQGGKVLQIRSKSPLIIGFRNIRNGGEIASIAFFIQHRVKNYGVHHLLLSMFDLQITLYKKSLSRRLELLTTRSEDQKETHDLHVWFLSPSLYL